MLYFIADFGSFEKEDQSPMNRLQRKLRYLINEGDTLVLGGDNFYPEGIQTRADLDMLVEFFADMPCQIYGVLGNHDYYGYIQPQVECERLGITSGAQVQNISDQLGICLVNTPIMCEYFCEQPGMWPRNHGDIPVVRLMKFHHMRGIDHALGQMSPTQCKYIVGHYPLFSDGFYKNNLELQMLLLPLFLKHDILGYICGHEHNMQVHEFSDAYFFQLIRDWLETDQYDTTFRFEPELLAYYKQMLSELDTWCFTWLKFTHIVCGSAAPDHRYRVKPSEHCVQYNYQNGLILALDPNGGDYTFILT